MLCHKNRKLSNLKGEKKRQKRQDSSEEFRASSLWLSSSEKEAASGQIPPIVLCTPFQIWQMAYLMETEQEDHILYQGSGWHAEATLIDTYSSAGHIVLAWHC